MQIQKQQLLIVQPEEDLLGLGLWLHLHVLANDDELTETEALLYNRLIKYAVRKFSLIANVNNPLNNPFSNFV